MSGRIIKYEGNVFTNDGQSTVKEFGVKLSAVKADLGLVPGLKVYYGYHGKNTGEWDRNFADWELKLGANMATAFKNAKLFEVSGPPGMSDPEIQNAVAKGNVLFTWCDSDTRVKKVMGKNMPKSV